MAAAVVPQHALASVMPEQLKPDWDHLEITSSMSNELTFDQLISGSLPWSDNRLRPEESLLPGFGLRQLMVRPCLT